MDKKSGGGIGQLCGTVRTFLQRCMFRILSVGPIPNHVAFIMDGNRRYAKKTNLEQGDGHRAGFSGLISILRYCYELGVKYVTVYAFSIDNFKRQPDEVRTLMDLMQEKIEGLLKEDSIMNQYGIRVYFIGNLKLLSEPVRVAAEKAMMASAENTNAVLLICVAYTSTDEIVHAIQKSCQENWDEIRGLHSGSVCNHVDGVTGSVQKIENNSIIKLVDIEKNMYMAVAPDPDIVVRSSGEARLSNFLLWQSTRCLLYSPAALWPEIGFWHLVWAVLNFQRGFSYFEKKKKQL